MEAMERTILHVDMDAFFASVEQHDRPELKGRPVVVGAPPDKRGVVAAASYEARRYGIHSAMPSREAGRLCPQAVFLPPNGRRYTEVSEQIERVFLRFTPFVEMVSIDEAFLDVTGTRALFGDGPAIARQIKQTILSETGLTASVGVAPNKFLAKIASDLDKPDGLTVVPEDRVGFLAPLPVSRLWGVGEKTQAILEKAGIRTIGDVQNVPAAWLAGLVGADSAEHFRRLARGEDDRVLELEHEEKSISREYTFPEDCTDREAIRRVLADLVEDVGHRLRSSNKYAGLGRLKLRWKGFKTITRQKPFASFVCDDFSLRQMAESLFDNEELTQPVRLVGFGVSHLAENPQQQFSLFDDGSGAPLKKERLSRTVDELRRKLGPDTIRRGAALGRSTGHREEGDRKLDRTEYS